MNIRREPTYISTEVWKALWLIAQSRSTADEQGLHRTVTPDEVADTLLRELIQEEYPELFEHRKQVQKMEKELIKKLGGGKVT